jgi:hypothetical protein
VVTEEDGSDTYSAIHTFKYGAWKKISPINIFYTEKFGGFKNYM